MPKILALLSLCSFCLVGTAMATVAPVPTHHAHRAYAQCVESHTKSTTESRADRHKISKSCRKWVKAKHHHHMKNLRPQPTATP